jgi:hypothetical protein
MRRVTPLTPANLPVAPDADDAGFGALKTAAGLLPLKALAIEARIVGLVAPASQCGPAASAEALAPQVKTNVPRGSGWHPLWIPKAMLQAHCRRAEAAMMDRVVRLARWLRSQVVQVVPQNMVVCEFECQEPHLPRPTGTSVGDIGR